MDAISIMWFSNQPWTQVGCAIIPQNGDVVLAACMHFTIGTWQSYISGNVVSPSLHHVYIMWFCKLTSPFHTSCLDSTWSAEHSLLGMCTLCDGARKQDHPYYRLQNNWSTSEWHQWERQTM